MCGAVQNSVTPNSSVPHTHRKGVLLGVFWVFCGVFFSPQMSNNFVCEQVGAANFVAPWSTSKKTARRSRMQVSAGAVGWLWVQQCSATALPDCGQEKALGRELGSSRGDLLLGHSGKVWRRQ